MSSYKTLCPKCKNENENFYITPHNGKGYCFNCGYLEHNGKIEQIKPSPHIETIRQIYTELTEYYHSCLDTPHIRYLHERGINDQSIQRFKIGYCPDSSHILYSHPLIKETGIALQKKPFLRDRIVFPYYFTDIVTDIRGRDWNNTHKDKYKTCYGGTIYRGAEYPYNINQVQQEKEIILTESEIKTILPQQYDIDAIGFPGITSKRILSHYGRKILCFDNQVNHRRELIDAIKAWVKKIPDVLIATLPLRGKEKQDIDEYIINYGIDAFRSVIRAAVPYQTWSLYNR